MWVTRYDWIPTISENINEKFFSIGGIQFENETYDINNKIWKHDFDTSEVTNWFGKQHVFEFEFVVSDPIGVSKMFDNLQIISNNVQPNEMEITVIGDEYEFKRDIVDCVEPRLNKLEVSESQPENITTTSNIHDKEKETKLSTVYKFDKRLKQKAIVKWQPFKDIYKFGRRIGNIQYKAGSWYAQIEPILINARKEARIRDKWAKIRIRYSGKDLAIIAAINTLINI